MIYSNVNSGATLWCPKAVCRALEWLQKNDIRAMEPGKHLIEGEDMFVMVQNMTTHSFEGSFLEAHYKYIDLMYWPEAGERIGVAHLDGDEEVLEDHPEDDYRLLPVAKNENFLHTIPGDFCVLFPSDAHRPGLHPAEETVTFRKAVVKIALKLVE